MPNKRNKRKKQNNNNRNEEDTGKKVKLDAEEVRVDDESTEDMTAKISLASPTDSKTGGLLLDSASQLTSNFTVEDSES